MKAFQSIQRLAVLAGLLFIAGSVQATDFSWTNTAGGTYSDAGNWNPSGPAVTGDQAIFANSASTYTVNFTGNAASSNLLITGSGQVVTFALAGNTYFIDTVPGDPGSGNYRALVGTGATESVTLIIDGGTLDAHRGQTYLGLSVGPNSTLIVTNGGRFMSASGSFASSSKVIIDGVGSSAFINNHIMNVFGDTAFDLNVQNGATALFVASGGVHSGDLLVDNGVLTNAALLTWSGGSATVQNGGTLYASDNIMFGQFFGGGSTVTVGNGVGTSVLSANAVILEENGSPDRNNIHMVVNTGGIVRVRNGSHVLSSGIDMQVADGSILSMVGGQVQMQTNAILGIRDLGAGYTGKGLLRGSGSFTKLNPGVNFLIRNDGGDIDVGDTSGAAGAGSTIGLLSVVGGDLDQNSSGTTFFDFDPSTPGSADLIDITDGSATIAGTLDFDAIAGGPISYGTWDFVKADSITYTGSDNMAALIGSLGLPGPADVSFGVISQGGFDYLRLTVEIPEPSTVVLLGLGGLLFTRRIRRRAQAIS